MTQFVEYINSYINGEGTKIVVSAVSLGIRFFATEICENL